MTMLEQILQQKTGAKFDYLVLMSLLMIILNKISTTILRIMMILSLIITSIRQAREPIKLGIQISAKERENLATSFQVFWNYRIHL